MTNNSNDARHKWPELLVQLLDAAVDSAQQCGLDAEKAEELAMAIIGNQAKLFGGLQIYIPKGEILKRALRDREIYRLAQRGNVESLAKQHNLSMKQIWEIQRTQRKLHIQQVQPNLL